MELHNSQLKESLTSGLNEDQKAVFIECIDGNSSVLCTGRAGTGKSRVIESVIKYMRESHSESRDQSYVAVTASTGIAAFNIRGITLHRFAGVGIVEDDIVAMIRSASKGSSVSYWRDTSVLIIDEISMISCQLFENLSAVGKAVRGSNEPFGGIRLLIFGDFLQLPPVSKDSSKVSRVFESHAWKDIDPKTFVLSEIIRQNDTTFASMMSSIRVGSCTREVCEYFESLSRDIEYNDGIEPVRLYSLRSTTNEYNQSRMALINTQPRQYSSIDIGNTNSLSQCPAPKTIILKSQCQVMLTRNLNEEAVNGSIGYVKGFKYVSETKSFQPLVTFVGHDTSFTMAVPRCTWETVAPDGRVISSRSQIPLILAWAITIHKSQGQTIPRLYVDLSNVFETGQAYVALSRSTDPSHLQVVGFRKDIVKVDESSLEYYESLESSHATSVAETTNQSWGRGTVDTQIMSGQLSMLEISSSSSQDSEN